MGENNKVGKILDKLSSEYCDAGKRMCINSMILIHEAATSNILETRVNFPLHVVPHYLSFSLLSLMIVWARLGFHVFMAVLLPLLFILVLMCWTFKEKRCRFAVGLAHWNLKHYFCGNLYESEKYTEEDTHKREKTLKNE